MDTSGNSSREEDLEWEIIDNFINDDYEEQYLRLVEERQMQQATPRRRRRAHIERSREEGHARLVNDYFSSNPVYTKQQFWRRFRMRRGVFLRIIEAIGNHDEYFLMRADATGRMGHSPLQKCNAAIRILAYGSPTDSVDDYVRIGEITLLECLDKFVRGVYQIFGDEYLRRPNNNDIERLLQIGEARGFPGMLGSIDCMHWEWKYCPVAWKGQFCHCDHGKPTIMLEAVASQDLWIWHAYFGVAGSNNDINVLNGSPMFNQVLEGQAPMVQYMVNGTQYNMRYYLADGIYPEWAVLVMTIPMPQDDKRKLFAQHQEAARKDVERAFGVLQSRFAIIRGPVRAWHMDTIKHILYACIILHNMIVEDERHTYSGHFDFSYNHPNNDVSTTDIHNGAHLDIRPYLQRSVALHDRQKHHQLQADLVEHIWECFGRDNQQN